MSAKSVSNLPAAPQAPESEDRRVDLGLAEPLALRIQGRAEPVPERALVLHFHGGAFVSGSLDSGAMVRGWLAAAGAVVVSVEYPLAPAQPFPAAIEAGHAALLWAARQRTKLAGPRARLFVAGEEAGANLAAALALVARDRQAPPLAGQILLSAMLDPCLGSASVRASQAGAATCPLACGWRAYLHSPCSTEHPYAAPGRALRLAGLPPALLVSAADDPLRDETFAYGRRLQQAGVAVAECALPGPTGWPAALLEGAASEPPFAGLVRARLHEFLASTPAQPAQR
ncbi:MAG: alpha/beta hydrolase fold domain-containing protein [Rhodocyclaceae bacterium]|nr:alpha/beta hydrolase fold domain-containing protein [Rhodocyclaceae bacterium]